ncbi:MAG: hypothetical protein AAF587_07095 [Bacteroidota bacterium]
MGQVLGVVAQSEGVFVSKSPIYAEEESQFSLANIFNYAGSFTATILEHSEMDERMRGYLSLTKEELQALKYNNILDLAHDGLEHYEVMEEEPPADFHAIDFFDDEISEGLMYSSKLEKQENWSSLTTLLNALSKMQALLFDYVRQKLKMEEEIDDLKYSMDNNSLLIGILHSLKQLYEIERVALVLAPY